MLKRAPEDLSHAIANWQEVLRVFAPHPCLYQMLIDTQRRIFDDCGAGPVDARAGAGGAGDPRIPCGGCSWRTPIVGENGEKLDDASLRDRGHR